MYSVESMIAILQCYINHRKNITVNIIVSNHRDIRKLKEAHAIASNWLNEYNFKIL